MSRRLSRLNATAPVTSPGENKADAMAKEKLTILIDKDLIRKAKHKALDLDKSVGEMIETLLAEFFKKNK